VARSLSFGLEQIQQLLDRRPAWRVLVYDVNQKDETGAFLASIGTVVREEPVPAIVGPRDFTADVVSVSMDEVAGDYAGAGIAATVATLVVADPNRVFDVATLLEDPEGDGRWLRRGNVLRLYAGDARIPFEEWPLLFTGKLTGQAGVRRTRVPTAGGPVSFLTCKAVGREADYLRYPSISSNFGQGTSHQTIVETIAQEDMGLDVDELALATFAPLVTGHTSTQFVDEPPLVSIARAMFPSGMLPRFNGAGKLSQSFGSILRGADRVYETTDLMLLVETPFAEVNPYNRVTVKGLDENQSKVVQPRQTLAEVSLTTGYFTTDEEVEVFWSEDQTVLAENIDLVIIKSVNAGLIPLGGSEDFSEIPAPGPGEGTIGSVLEIETGFAPWLIIFLTVTYVVLSLIPDGVLVAETIPIGRFQEAVQLATALLTMTRVGRGIYRFEGEPFEYVFKELTAIAEVQGLRPEDRSELVIENHLLSTQALVDGAAREVLFREQAKGNPRRVSMIHDLALEVDDLFELASEERRFLVTGIRYTLQRGAAPVLAEVTCLEVTAGVFQ
jgi:hypothetical protein